MDNLLFLILLSILQGFLEWLPVSSEGNIFLVVISVLGISPSKAFEIAVTLHIGTMFSAIIFYRRDLKNMLKKICMFKFDGYLKFIMVSTLSTGISFLPSYIFLKRFLSISSGSIVTLVIGVMLLITGFMLHISGKRVGERGEISLLDAFILGIAQGFSIIPGISRSGITVSTLLLRGYGSSFSLKTSFILSIPAVMAIALIELNSLLNISLAEMVLTVITTCLIGLATIKSLTYLAKKIDFDKFCILIGFLSIVSGLINL